MTETTLKRMAVGVAALLVLSVVAWMCLERVPAGHVKAATLFGDVRPDAYEPGMHLVNPLLSFHTYDVRHKTHYSKSVSVMSRDELRTEIDISVQYRVEGAMAPTVLDETGTAKQLVDVHLEPVLRSTLREQGRSTASAEEFAENETQMRVQENVLARLRDYMAPKGVKVMEVLLRDVRLPPVINKAVEQKKERQQEVERQQAELERFTTEQEQKVATAKAELEAARLEAESVRVRAEAEADRIRMVNAAIGADPAYVQVKWLETLAEMGKDPAAKMFFMGSGRDPMPLLHLGEPLPAPPGARPSGEPKG